MYLVILFTTLYRSSCTGQVGVYSTPEYIVVGKETGEIYRCPLLDPNACELFHKATKAVDVLSTIVHDEYLYASFLNGVILKCSWYNKNQCAVFRQAQEKVYSLTVTGGYLYADQDNIMLRCKLNQPHSCTEAYKSDQEIRGLYRRGKYVYIATYQHLLRCSKDINYCQKVIKLSADYYINSVTGWSDLIILLQWNGNICIHNVTSNSTSFRELKYTYPYFYDIAVFNEDLYVIVWSTYSKIIKCRMATNHCIEFAQQDHGSSISFVYSTYHIQNNYLQEGPGCGLQSHPSLVFNYEDEERALLEVSVWDGKLYDARDNIVDTRAADVGYSGRAAVFAMGLDGQILISYAHRSGLVHISSLFAGNPVSGAGEMVVEDGVIKRILACSEHYQADVQLNRQVVTQLYAKGYTKEIKLEECVYTCNGED